MCKKCRKCIVEKKFNKILVKLIILKKINYKKIGLRSYGYSKQEWCDMHVSVSRKYCVPSTRMQSLRNIRASSLRLLSLLEDAEDCAMILDTTSQAAISGKRLTACRFLSQPIIEHLSIC